MTLAIVAVIGGIFSPVISGAWLWDDDRDIEVSGQIHCMGFDVDKPWGIPQVEWFTIRGRSDVIENSNPLAPTYRVKVPPGWKIEWDVKCSGSSKGSGSFDVTKKTVGSSYSMTRHICDQTVGFAPCTDVNFGGCVTMLISGELGILFSRSYTMHDALLDLSQAYNGGYGPSDAQACFKAITNSSTSRSTPKPEPIAPTPTIQTPTATTAAEVHAPEPTAGRPQPTAAQPAPTSPQPTAPQATAVQPTVAQPTAPQPTAARPTAAKPTAAKPTAAQPTPAPTVAKPATRPETAGGVANTWTNYGNAGGQAGQQIAKGATVQISCRVEGFRVSNGNPWWYRIASSPWNNGFYVSADAFYNNGQTSGSLVGTPWVDPAVPLC
ncbi:MAG: hypothetical protein AB7L13_16335 [Acidimicrobiia bacterium]